MTTAGFRVVTFGDNGNFYCTYLTDYAIGICDNGRALGCHFTVVVRHINIKRSLSGARWRPFGGGSFVLLILHDAEGEAGRFDASFVLTLVASETHIRR